MKFNEKQLKAIRGLADNRDVLVIQGRNSQGLPFSIEGCVYILIDDEGNPYMPNDGFMFFQGQVCADNSEMFVKLHTHSVEPKNGALFVERAQLKNTGEVLFENPDVEKMVQEAIAYKKELDKKNDEFISKYLVAKKQEEDESVVEEWKSELIGKPVIYNRDGKESKGVVLSADKYGVEITTGVLRFSCPILDISEIKIDETVVDNLQAYTSSDQMI